MNAHTIVELEKLRLGLQLAMSAEMLDAQVDVVYDHMIDGARATIRGAIWAEKESARRQTIKYPRDWWQAAKERWFPTWLLKRYPVDYHVVEIDVKAIYPTFKQSVPTHEMRLAIQRQDYYSNNYWKEE